MSRRPTHRGAAMVMAVVVLGLLSSVFIAISVLATQEMRRTQQELSLAQHEQLQLAAIVFARERVGTDNPVSGALGMPEGIDAVLSWKEIKPDQRTCLVHIGFLDSESARRLTFTKSGEGWTLTKSEPIEADVVRQGDSISINER